MITAEPTRIIRVHVPSGKMVQVQMFQDDHLWNLPKHLLENYPDSFPGKWTMYEILLYHRVAGRVNLLKVCELPPEAELMVVRLDIGLMHRIAHAADKKAAYQQWSACFRGWFPIDTVTSCFGLHDHCWPPEQLPEHVSDLDIRDIQWPSTSEADGFQPMTMVMDPYCKRIGRKI